MPPHVILTVREHIYWAYANLARSNAAVRDGATKYWPRHYAIRNALFRGLTEGSKTMRSIYENEKEKIVYPQVCAYCGTVEALTQDHLIPRLRGGTDEAYNLVWACRPHNSSKGARDVLEWLALRQEFPTILLLERYIKLVARYCESHDLMDQSYPTRADLVLPFRLDLLPYQFPPPAGLKMWIVPARGQN